MRFARIVAAAASLAAAVPAGAAEAPRPLVFASNRAPNLFATKLYVVDAATLRRRLLTPGSAVDSGAAWTADGRFVVVARASGPADAERGAPSHLVLVRPRDGRVLRRLTGGSGEDCPRPSPDGTRLAFCSEKSLWVAQADGHRARRVPGTSRYLDAAWTRDGRALVVRRSDERLVLLSPSGRVLRHLRRPAGRTLGVHLTAPRGGRRVCPDYHGQLAICGRHGRRAILPPFGNQDVDFEALAWSPGGGRLLYTLGVTLCDSDVYATVPGTTGAWRLVDGPRDDLEPALSPDGGYLAFVRDGRSADHVYVKRLPTGRQLDLGDGASPSWSPDGRSVVVASRAGLFVVSRDGGGRRRIAVGAYNGADWSPDGATIAASRGGGDLVLVPPGGGEPRPLGLKGYSPAWSPDGRQIAYSDGFALHVANADGSGARQLTRIGEDPGRDITADVHPAWSPDGSRIVFASGTSLEDWETTGIHGDAVEPYPYELHAIAPDGTGDAVLVSGPGADFDPSWR